MPSPIDSVCKCRHRSDHHIPRLVQTSSGWRLVPGTGTCGQPGCACERFRAAGWLRPRSTPRAQVCL
jgi:hypothetical protein